MGFGEMEVTKQGTQVASYIAEEQIEMLQRTEEKEAERERESQKQFTGGAATSYGALCAQA